MKTKPLFLSGCIALLSFAFAGTASAGDMKVEEALRDLDAQWSAAAAAKDVDKTVSFYSDDALVMPPNAPSATTKEAIRKIWKDLLTDANISWKTKKVEVAQSGDLAFSSGTYEVTLMTRRAHRSTIAANTSKSGKSRATGRGSAGWISGIPIFPDPRQGLPRKSNRSRTE